MIEEERLKFIEHGQAINTVIGDVITFMHDEERICTLCGIKKPITEFYKLGEDKFGKEYRRRQCKECMRELQRKYCRARYREKYREDEEFKKMRHLQGIKFRKDNPEYYREYYQNNKERIKDYHKKHNYKYHKKYREKLKNEFPRKVEDKKFCKTCGGELNRLQIMLGRIFCSNHCSFKSKINLR